MFHSRRANNKINHVHEGSLRIVYKDNYISSVDLLPKDKLFTIHQGNIQSYAIELFKVKRSLSNVIMCKILKTRTQTNNLRSQADFVRDCVNTQCYGLNSLIYFVPKILDMIPLEIKNINSLQKFKTEIRKWALENCSCYLCRSYIQNLGFVELV